MGKRSGFKKSPRDYYRTIDPNAVVLLRPHIRRGQKFIAPMAGDGVLVDQLVACGMVCVYKADIEPQRADIERRNCFDLGFYKDLIAQHPTAIFIENPMWSRDHTIFAGRDKNGEAINRRIPDWSQPLHRAIAQFSSLAPTWFLFDMGWLNHSYAPELMTRCAKVQMVGRLRWFEGSKDKSLDDVCWYLFDGQRKRQMTCFHAKPRGFKAIPMKAKVIAPVSVQAKKGPMDA